MYRRDITPLKRLRSVLFFLEAQVQVKENQITVLDFDLAPDLDIIFNHVEVTKR